jgi:hypothetical protein
MERNRGRRQPDQGGVARSNGDGRLIWIRAVHLEDEGYLLDGVRVSLGVVG